MQKKNGRVHLRREEGAMGDQCGVPVAASTRREKAREADVVGYCPFAKHRLERACVYNLFMHESRIEASIVRRGVLR